MQRAGLIFLFLTANLFSVNAIAVELNKKIRVYITNADTPLNEQPNTEAKRITTLAADTRLQLVQQPRDSTWIKVRRMSDAGSGNWYEGWVNGDQVRENNPEVGKFGGLGDCASTVVSPTVLISTAHCLRGLKGEKFHTGYTEMVFSYVNTLQPLENKYFRILKTHSFKKNIYDELGSDDDIGVAILAEPIPISLVPTPMGLTSVQPAPSQIIKIIGFGSCTAEQDEDIYGTKYIHWYSIGTNAVATCKGDSGGPYMHDSGPEAGKIFGVHSSAYRKPDGSRGKAIFGILTPERLAKIQSIIKEEEVLSAQRVQGEKTKLASLKDMKKTKPWLGVPTRVERIRNVPADQSVEGTAVFSEESITLDFEVLVLGESLDQKYLWVQYRHKSVMLPKVGMFVNDITSGDQFTNFGWVPSFLIKPYANPVDKSSLANDFKYLSGVYVDEIAIENSMKTSVALSAEERMKIKPADTCCRLYSSPQNEGFMRGQYDMIWRDYIEKVEGIAKTPTGDFYLVRIFFKSSFNREPVVAWVRAKNFIFE